MKNILILFALLLNFNSFSQMYLAKGANVRIFSSSPLENIEGKSNSASCAFNSKTGKVIFKIAITSFKFEKALMQEHFNETYMESEKFPLATFEGNILDLPDLTKNGEYQVKAKGTVTIHGVAKEREISLTITVKDGEIFGKSIFKVKCSDHKINIPKVVLKNIAQEIEVSINANFKSLKK